jgi:hypothetical protein
VIGECAENYYAIIYVSSCFRYEILDDHNVNRGTNILFAACVWIGFILPLQAEDQPSFDLQDGDIVFSGSAFGQGAAIIAATGSPITHCGIAFKKDGSWMVLEAVQPVRVTKLEISWRELIRIRFPHVV